MTLEEFARTIPGFAGLKQPDRILHFAWYLHTHGKQERFDQKALRSCYKSLHLDPPSLSKEITRLLEKRPKVLLQEGDNYKLEHSVRARFDEEYGVHQTTIVVSQLLKDLVGKLSDEAERLFLTDALKCYRVEAFRPTVVMTWNLAYDHLLHWILADAKRLDAFNTRIVPVVGPKRGSGLVMASREDFEDLKESQVIDIIGPSCLPETSSRS